MNPRAESIHYRFDRLRNLWREMDQTMASPLQSLLERLIMEQSIGILRISLKVPSDVLWLQAQEVIERLLVALEQVLPYRTVIAEGRPGWNGSAAGAAASW